MCGYFGSRTFYFGVMDMKKHLALLLTLSIMFILTACAGGELPTVPSGGTTPSADAGHSHSYKETVNPPTCTEQGYTTFTCTCGDAYIDNYIDATGHTIEKNLCIICKEEFAYSEGLKFSLNEDEQSYTLSGIGSCTDSVVYIPPEYNGLPVTGMYLLDNIEHLTEVIIPRSIIKLYTLDTSLFPECTKLASIVVESGNPLYHSAGNCVIKTETKELIAGCAASVIPDDGSVTAIRTGAFAMCTNLTDITIPNNVTVIGPMAFALCTNLTSITIPGSVIRIMRNAFSNCTSLSSVTIQDGVTRIEYAAFYRCSSLSSITIPGSVTSIETKAFSECTNLTSITIPGSVENIGIFAFDGCSSLSEITFQDGVTNISFAAFAGCTGLTSVTIPGSVTKIEEIAFSSCELLREIHYDGTVAQWNAISKDDRWDNSTGEYTIYCTDGEIKKGS